MLTGSPRTGFTVTAVGSEVGFPFSMVLRGAALVLNIPVLNCSLLRPLADNHDVVSLDVKYVDGPEAPSVNPLTGEKEVCSV